MQRKVLTEGFHIKALSCRFSPTSCCNFVRTLTVEAGERHDHLYKDLPQSPKSKSERKPYVTPMKILIQKAKVEKEARKAQPCRMLEEPPDNGLLVPELVNIAHQVHRSREILLSGLSKLVKTIPVQRCRYVHECRFTIGWRMFPTTPYLFQLRLRLSNEINALSCSNFITSIKVHFHLI